MFRDCRDLIYSQLIEKRHGLVYGRALQRSKAFLLSTMAFSDGRSMPLSALAFVDVCTSRTSASLELSMLCEQGQLEDALQAAQCMYKQGASLSKDDFYQLLQVCSKRGDTIGAHRVLSLIVLKGLESDSFLGYHLIRLFASCGGFLEAYALFLRIERPNSYVWSAIVLACSKFGQIEMALYLYQEMQQVGIIPDKFLFTSILKCCGHTSASKQGKLAHDQIIRHGFERDVIVGNMIIDMYAKCGFLDDAHHLFFTMGNKDTVSWGTIISAYARHGCGSFAVGLFFRMLMEGIVPNKVIFLCVSKACGELAVLDSARVVHGCLLEVGVRLDAVLGSAFVDMYAKCWSIEDAWSVFCGLEELDVLAWCVMIAGCIQNRHAFWALQLFESLCLKGFWLNASIYTSAINACGLLGAIVYGQHLHCDVITNALEGDEMLAGAIVDMYGKCGCLEEARKLAQWVPDADIILFGSIIAGHARYGEGIYALRAFVDMQKKGIEPSKQILSCILKACNDATLLLEGKLIHQVIIRYGHENDNVIGSALIDMYVKCISLEDAYATFIRLPGRDLVSWGSLVIGYAQHSQGFQALELFEQMLQEGLEPDGYIFSGVLKACGNLGLARHGRLVHDQLVRRGVELDLVMDNTLVDMYGKCKCLYEARHIFDRLLIKGVELWSTLVAGYVHNGQSEIALEVFDQSLEEGVNLDAFMLSCVAKACSNTGAILVGKSLHDLIIWNGLSTNSIVGNSLVDMYAKFGLLEDARHLFDRMQNRDVVTCGAMLAGYAYQGCWVNSLELFQIMDDQAIESTTAILLTVLKACCNVGALVQGRLIHDQVIRCGQELDVLLGSTIVDMYAKCGSLDEAENSFCKLTKPDVVAWGALIDGYARDGNYGMAGKCFGAMEHQGVHPNDVIFTSILGGCSHAVLVEEAQWYFKMLTDAYGLVPSIEHYNCMVDLLARAGHLHEAEDVIQTMTVSPDPVIWMSLLSVCARNCSLKLGKRLYEEIIGLIPTDATGCATMCSIYADADLWDDVRILQCQRVSQGVFKKPGRSWIEVNHKLHEFTVEQGTPQDGICAKFILTYNLMKNEGYVPQVATILKLCADTEQSSSHKLV